METSFFLAKLLSPILLVAGVGVLVNRGSYRALIEEFLNSGALLYLGGLLAVIAGLAILLFHNVWELDWRILITLLGWITFLFGALFVLAPRLAVNLTRRMYGKGVVMPVVIDGVIPVVIGVVLFYYGY